MRHANLLPALDCSACLCVFLSGFETPDGLFVLSLPIDLLWTLFLTCIRYQRFAGRKMYHGIKHKQTNKKKHNAIQKLPQSTTMPLFCQSGREELPKNATSDIVKQRCERSA